MRNRPFRAFDYRYEHERKLRRIFEESLKSLDMQPGAIITGIVVDIDGDWVTVHAGLKSEGVIPVEQFYNEQGELTIKVGDEVHVALDAVEDGFGETKLSRESQARRELDCSGSGFRCRRSGQGRHQRQGQGRFHRRRQRHPRVPAGFAGRRSSGSRHHPPGRQRARVQGHQARPEAQQRCRFRRSVLEAENSAEREALLESLQEGQQVKGIVKNLTDYGAFVDLGGVDGLLHITDMAWKRIKHPSEIVNVGDEIDVKVLKFDRERNRVSLGLKQLGEDPWVAIKARYPEGTRVMARVTNLTDYGCFAELEEGVEGLVHVSEMDWTNKNIHPSKVVQVGDEVEVQVLDIDEERRRISLGIKQCKSNPWEDFSSQFNKGDRISGTIKSITDFGIFIGLDGGIDGLVHLSDISWNEVGEEAVRRFKKGDELETVILSVDPERERISLGIKQLEDDPFSNYASLHEKGSIVRGTVKEVDAKGAVISLGDDIEGILKASEISRDRVEDAQRPEGRRGSRSQDHQHRPQEPRHQPLRQVQGRRRREDAMKELRKQEVESAGPTTIGDLIRAQMENQG